MYVQNGVTSLDKMRSHFNSFAPGGDIPNNEEEIALQKEWQKMHSGANSETRDLGLKAVGNMYADYMYGKYANPNKQTVWGREADTIQNEGEGLSHQQMNEYEKRKENFYRDNNLRHLLASSQGTRFVNDPSGSGIKVQNPLFMRNSTIERKANEALNFYNNGVTPNIVISEDIDNGGVGQYKQDEDKIYISSEAFDGTPYHEYSHLMDFKLSDYIANDTGLGKLNHLDAANSVERFIENDDIVKPYGYLSYYNSPTEIRARVNEAKRTNNIDINKHNFTEDDIDRFLKGKGYKELKEYTTEGNINDLVDLFNTSYALGGGLKSPFSYSKIPVVRYDNGGEIDNPPMLKTADLSYQYPVEPINLNSETPFKSSIMADYVHSNLDSKRDDRINKYHIQYLDQDDFGGSPKLNYALNRGKQIYTDDAGNAFFIKDYINKYSVEGLQKHLSNTGYGVLNNDMIKKNIGKRDYIGGTPEESRLKVANMIPGFMDAVKTNAELYGVDPNLLYHRISKEGYLDQILRKYNNELSNLRQKDYFTNTNFLDEEISGFQAFGLDNAGTHLMRGDYTLKNPDSKWETLNAMNEKHQDVTSVYAPVRTNIEIMAAEINYIKDQLIKRGYSSSDINKYINAAFNMGINHKDLKNEDYVNKTYGNIPVVFK